MRYLKKIMLLLTIVCSNMLAFAQAKAPEMADVMRSNGKIYIVVAVCLTVLVGLFIYVFALDRKISGFEKSLNN